MVKENETNSNEPVIVKKYFIIIFFKIKVNIKHIFKQKLYR